MNCFLIYDTYSKSIIGIYNDENSIIKIINKLVRDDMNDEIQKIKYSILSETNIEKRKELCMTLENLKIQLSINDIKNTYCLRENCIQRYIKYNKLMNNINSPIFL